jgi:hypothetical protein
MENGVLSTLSLTYFLGVGVAPKSKKVVEQRDWRVINGGRTAHTGSLNLSPKSSNNQQSIWIGYLVVDLSASCQKLRVIAQKLQKIPRAGFPALSSS